MRKRLQIVIINFYNLHQTTSHHLSKIRRKNNLFSFLFLYQHQNKRDSEIPIRVKQISRNKVFN
ncbi:hypothetical protein Mgra_00007486 [Meloidogyne graminicola]|uniref:Uncharacterized protein n=1 Tax=Meloidogyne graminicola TaxID=189291 RepID=A0A8S9ZIG1_9BILA|nr:hypothetical protein Mgra_00007486 [Meloidogyne graminicola]